MKVDENLIYWFINKLKGIKMKKKTSKGKQPKVNPIIREAKYFKNLMVSLRHPRKTTYISKETGDIVKEE